MNGVNGGRKEVRMRPIMRAVMLTAGAVLTMIAVPNLRSGLEIPATAQVVEPLPLEPLPVELQPVEPQAGFFALLGGPVLAKVARTQTTPSALPEGAAWQNLPGASLFRVVAAGTTDLFNIAFSGECQVRSLGTGDTARIRIAHTINGAAVAPFEPYDGDQRFCSSVPLATHSGLWAQRVGAGNHGLQVQIMTVDFAPDNGAITSVLDDWTFELVVYD